MSPAIDYELQTAISVTETEVAHARAAYTRTGHAYVALRSVGSREQYEAAQRQHSAANEQLMSALARLADLKVQAGAA